MTNRSRLTPSRWPLCLLMALMLFPSLAGAQSAADLMRNALEAQADRLSGIENVTIVQEVMGMETSMYMEKRDVDGTPVLLPVSVMVAGRTQTMPQEVTQPDWASPFQEQWIERARLVGDETLDGLPVKVLAIEDFSGLDLPQLPGAAEGQGDLRPTSIQFWMDTDDYLTRKVSADMEGTKADGSPASVHMEMYMDDYREVDGYLHPFVTRTVMEGMMDAADLDESEVQAQLDQMRAQLENIPEAQRAMVEGMMGAQIERLEKMLEGDGDMEMTITVKDIKVNQGPPGGG